MISPEGYKDFTLDKDSLDFSFTVNFFDFFKDDVARSVHTVKTSFYYAELCFCVTFFHSMYYLKPPIFHFSHK